MGGAIGEMLPLAIGIAISPLAIVAVILMLTTTQARTNGPAFLAGWLLANNSTVMIVLFAVFGVVLLGNGIGGL